MNKHIAIKVGEKKAEAKMLAYAHCINEIEDFFEYRYKAYDQGATKTQIMGYINDLVKKLGGIK